MPRTLERGRLVAMGDAFHEAAAVSRCDAAPAGLPRTDRQRVGPRLLRRALAAGIERVIAQREAINRINVFPVPDGDTGSNLAFTLGSVLTQALGRPAAGAGVLLRAVGDAAIDGARGNSGAILAQFLQGVAEAAASAVTLGHRELAFAAGVGSSQARAALSEPREGTMLSVIAAFAQALQAPAASLRDAFLAALASSRRALADTPRQLDVLRQAGVVDAGAQGFVDLLEGIADYLAEGRAARVVSALDLDAVADVHADAEPSPQRWCAECLVTRADGTLDLAALRNAVRALDASSVVIAGSASRARVHAHVDDPGVLFARLAQFGATAAHKADDMWAQQRLVALRQPVAVVTDSGADLPAALLERHAISVLPVRVSFGAEEFLDKVSLSPAEFYRRARGGGVHPQTSQPPPGDFRRQFEVALSHRDAAVYVGLSRAVSGTLQAGEAAAARVDPARVRVLDSGHASCGQALIVLAAARAAGEGLDAEAIAARLPHWRARTHTFAAARDIAYAVRGGRVPAWVGPLATWLPVVPIARMHADGRLRVAGALPGARDAPQRLAKWIARRLPGGRRWRLLVGHAGAASDGETLLAALQARLDCAESWLVEAGPAVGAHAGPGALVVGVQEVDD